MSFADKLHGEIGKQSAPSKPPVTKDAPHSVAPSAIQNLSKQLAKGEVVPTAMPQVSTENIPQGHVQNSITQQTGGILAGPSPIGNFEPVKRTDPFILRQKILLYWKKFDEETKELQVPESQLLGYPYEKLYELYRQTAAAANRLLDPDVAVDASFATIDTIEKISYLTEDALGANLSGLGQSSRNHPEIRKKLTAIAIENVDTIEMSPWKQLAMYFGLTLYQTYQKNSEDPKLNPIKVVKYMKEHRPSQTMLDKFNKL